VAAPAGGEPVVAGLAGTLIGFEIGVGDQVRRGQPVALVEVMKMEQMVLSPVEGTVLELLVAVDDQVGDSTPLLRVSPGPVPAASAADPRATPGAVRPELAALEERRRLTLDAGRPKAVARRHGVGHRTARENIADLVDAGSFSEYGGLALAAQRHRHSHEELVAASPADGLVVGTATINAAAVGAAAARALVLAYDWTVFAGTQGALSHRKAERAFALAERSELPVVLFAEGGGGRPGDDRPGPTGFDMTTFWRFGRLAAVAPSIGIASRYCFAGNAALLGCCDAIIATADAAIGMGGPAMIEAGGLGRPAAAEIGPAAKQARDGVVDLLVEDDAEAVAVARRYLSYFQGPDAGWECGDQLPLRDAVPRNRRRGYAVRELLETLCDSGSVLELRAGFGRGVLTALARIEGRPIGILANDPGHLGGAIDSDAADKAARFLQLCDARGLPILSLCDTPGFLVGVEAEEGGHVRHCSRLFVAAARLEVPLLTIVTRKAYGLGAQAMAGGSFQAPQAIVAWPTGEFGGMGPEGYVQLAFAKELAAIADEDERRADYERRVGEVYERGRGLNLAEHFELDDVIDPVDSRAWIARTLDAAPVIDDSAPPHRRAWVDPW
jgi:acetyl-CoA carboxylase carboxyltransferase component